MIFRGVLDLDLKFQMLKVACQSIVENHVIMKIVKFVIVISNILS